MIKNLQINLLGVIDLNYDADEQIKKAIYTSTYCLK